MWIQLTSSTNIYLLRVYFNVAVEELLLCGFADKEDWLVFDHHQY